MNDESRDSREHELWQQGVAEAERLTHTARLWGELMDATEQPRDRAEALRRTARGAVEDWLEARHDDR